MFGRAAGSPVIWLSTAESLMRAARILLPTIDADTRAYSDPARTVVEHPVTQVYMLLAGFAVENLAKAALVTQGKPALDGDSLAKAFKTHNLLALLELASITLDEDEQDLVERLEVAAIWSGRYPIPLKLDDTLPRAHHLGGSGPLAGFSSSDPQRIERLVERLTSLIT